MDGSGSDPLQPPVSPPSHDDPGPFGTERGELSDQPNHEPTLAELVDHLAGNPEECWRAYQGLGSIDVETRLEIIAGLTGLLANRGVENLLLMLGSSPEPATRSAALAILEGHRLLRFPDESVDSTSSGPNGPETDDFPNQPDEADSRELVPHSLADRPRMVECMVTAVDGLGRGTIMVSVTKAGQRRTAAFECDVRRGIIDVVGTLELESNQAGSMAKDVRAGVQGGWVEGSERLGLGLLSGCLALCDRTTPPAVGHWLKETLGPAFGPRPFPARVPAQPGESLDGPDLLRRASALLGACPGWVDGSALTYELAEEILLREGSGDPDPGRDAGAYRFLFERRLIHRLEMYRRMLFWMAVFWEFSNQHELARTAGLFAWQLSDEQFAVPSHPFAVELTTRSLAAALRAMRPGDGPEIRGL